MSQHSIRAKPQPNCFICNTVGIPLYHNLTDRLFTAPGEWNIVRCSNCGLLWHNPMPVEEDIIHAYDEYYTHQTSNSVNHRKEWMKAVYLRKKYGYPLHGLNVVQKIIGTISLFDLVQHAWIDTRVMYLPYQPGGKLLEIGFGSGNFLIQAESYEWQVEGIDFDPKAVDVAAKRGLNVHVGTLQSQNYPDNSFDAVTMSHVIEHIHDAQSLLTECLRILKPGGILTFITPNNKGLTHHFFHESWFALDPPRHLYLYNSQSTKMLLEQSGFQQARIFTTNRNANTFITASHSIRKTGRYTLGLYPPFILRVISKVVEWIEYLGLRFFSQIGEELVVIAKKSPKS